MWKEYPRSRPGIWLMALLPWVLAAILIASGAEESSEFASLLTQILLLAPPLVLLAYFGASDAPRVSKPSATLSAKHVVFAAVFGCALPALAAGIAGAWAAATAFAGLGMVLGSFAVTRRDVSRGRTKRPDW